MLYYRIVTFSLWTIPFCLCESYGSAGSFACNPVELIKYKTSYQHLLYTVHNHFLAVKLMKVRLRWYSLTKSKMDANDGCKFLGKNLLFLKQTSKQINKQQYSKKKLIVQYEYGPSEPAGRRLYFLKTLQKNIAIHLIILQPYWALLPSPQKPSSGLILITALEKHELFWRGWSIPWEQHHLTKPA